MAAKAWKPCVTITYFYVSTFLLVQYYSVHRKYIFFVVLLNFVHDFSYEVIGCSLYDDILAFMACVL